MNQIKSAVKKHRIECLSLFCYLFLSYLLLEQIFLFVLFCLLQILLYLILASRREKSEQEYQRRISAYSFFACFLENLIENRSVEQSYETGLSYLISFQESIPFEELSSEHCPDLYEYQTYFRTILEKDQKNEAMLLHFESLSESVEKKLSATEKEKRRKKKFASYVLLFPTSAFLLALIKNIIQVDMKSSILPIILLLILSLPYPLFILTQTSRLRRNDDAE